MEIKKDYDCVKSDAIDPAKGTDPDSYEGIMPSLKAVPETPGEKDMNDTGAYHINKKQPFGEGGSGYTD